MTKFSPKHSSARDKTLASIPRRRIELDLRRKGIADTIIKEILRDEVDDTDALRKLIAKRAKRYDDVNKLKAYLLRAGFNYDDINREIGEYYNGDR